jgi:hypothetical protein
LQPQCGQAAGGLRVDRLTAFDDIQKEAGTGSVTRRCRYVTDTGRCCQHLSAAHVGAACHGNGKAAGSRIWKIMSGQTPGLSRDLSVGSGRRLIPTGKLRSPGSWRGFRDCGRRVARCTAIVHAVLVRDRKQPLKKAGLGFCIHRQPRCQGPQARRSQ